MSESDCTKEVFLLSRPKLIKCGNKFPVVIFTPSVPGKCVSLASHITTEIHNLPKSR